MSTKRCTNGERQAFDTEPALGTLKQRLDIICRRLGILDYPRKPNKADEAFVAEQRNADLR